MRSCVFHDLTSYLGAMGTAEHMLFFSSEKYPEEDSYSKYLTEVNSDLLSSKLNINYHENVFEKYNQITRITGTCTYFFFRLLKKFHK